MKDAADKLKLAIIGCGAIAEQGHLPGAAVSQLVEVTLLVDQSLEQAKKVADKFSIREFSDTIESVPKFADAAIVSTPPGPHVDICSKLIEMGIPILVEKPIALTVFECEKMSNMADDHNVLLVAGMTRRFFRSDRFLRNIVRDREFGALKSFVIENGYDYSWSSATAFILSKEQAGGGVLMGLGSHVLDSLIWIAGEVDSVDYFCDAEGGIESECLLEIKLKSGAVGTVELSRSRNLHNRYLLEFEQGKIEAPFYGDEIIYKPNNSTLKLKGHVIGNQEDSASAQSIGAIMAEELDDFANAIRGESAPAATARDATKSIALIEQCYANPKLLEHSWMQSDLMEAIK